MADRFLFVARLRFPCANITLHELSGAWDRRLRPVKLFYPDLPIETLVPRTEAVKFLFTRP
jgi:hypothetical protein